ncbi:MAG: NAD(P)/FAD-dependent oxidoreductase [Vicinamibacterales bacterium]
MTTKYGLSPWIREIPKSKQPSFPRLRGEHESAVAVIGGGLTGVFTAQALAASGVKVALVEAERLGSGTSGRSTGLMAPEPASSYRELEQRHGRRAARAMHEMSRRAALDLAAAARRLRVQAHLHPLAAYRYVPLYQSPADLQREATARQRAGLDAAWRRPADLARELALQSEGGARLAPWAWANPYRLLLGFAAAAVKRRAAIFERSRVTRVRPGAAGVEVVTEGGRLLAGTVIVCTAEPGPLFRQLARHVTTLERYAVLTEALPAPVRKALGRRGAIVSAAGAIDDAAAFVHGDRLLLTGAAQKPTSARARDKVLVQRTGQLMYEALTTWPAISGLQPAFGWEIRTTMGADGAMFAGPHRNFPRHLFAWGADHDPARAFLASRILLRHHQGAASKSDDHFALTRS